MSEPIVSVVIPAYNVAAYIKTAVLSALDQTVADLEVIVVDDGSTDATPRILAEMSERLGDARLRIVSGANGGLAAARNRGIAAASGRYVGFLDGDDAWHPRKVERHLAALEAEPEVGITFSDSQCITEDGQPTRRMLQSPYRRPTLWQMIRRNHVANGSTPIVRRSCFEEAGCFDERLRSCEDYEMWLRILHVTRCKIERVPETLTLYRMRATSLSANTERFVASADLAMELVRERMPLVPDRIFRHGHAEHYRIAARKAASFRELGQARRCLRKALRLYPWLFVIDQRALMTAVLSLTAGRGEDAMHTMHRMLGGGMTSPNQRTRP